MQAKQRLVSSTKVQAAEPLNLNLLVKSAVGRKFLNADHMVDGTFLVDGLPTKVLGFYEQMTKGAGGAAFAQWTKTEFKHVQDLWKSGTTTIEIMVADGGKALFFYCYPTK